MASTKFLSNLVIDGSGGTVLDVQGSVGQLFSVTDSLTGDLFAVSDISGIPILNVNSSGAVDIDGTLNLGDSDKIQLGASQDLQIYHNGNDSYIQDSGTGDLRIISSATKIYDADSSHFQATFTDGGSVDLYYGGNKKLETTSTGVTVTGNIGATNFSGSSSGTNTGDQDLSGYSTASGVEDNADVTDTANVVAALTAGTNVSIAANGTISATDTNYYLNAIERTDSTNTLVFGVSGATNQSFTFGANAFNSTTIPAAEQYTAHEDTSTLSGTYGSTANGTKIDQITVDSNGHITNISTGATGNMTGFFVEDGDGTEVQINNANEWKFVEGTGININWTDTDQGIDSDPYDLTFSLKDNSVSATQLNVSGNGTSGQVLTSDGDGTFSWSAKTANTDTITSVGISGSETSGTVTLTGAGATSITQSGGAIEIRSTNTQYSDATTSTAGLMSTTDKSKLDGIASGAEVNVQSDWNATTGDAFINNKPTLGTASASAATDFVAVAGDTMTGNLYISKDNPVIILNDTTSDSDANQVAYISFQDNGTEEAWIGWGSNGNSDFTVKNAIGKVVLDASNGAYIGSSQIATESYVGTAISNLVDSSPATLDTLNELAAALGDDANFSTTVTNSIATKLPKAGGTLTGGLTIDYAAGTNPLLSLFNDSNGNGAKINFSDQSTPSQNGTLMYVHSDGNSYGTGNAFVFSGTESTMSVVALGNLMYRDGIYKTPSSGTGAGTRKDANWDTAYGWGNHASAGYLTSETFGSSDVVLSLSGDDVTAGESITLAGGLSYSGTTLTSANDNTTYTAGTGLTLTNTTFSVTANTYATAAQGTTADAALPKAGGTMTGQLVTGSGGLGIVRSSTNGTIWFNSGTDANHALWNAYYGESPTTRGSANSGFDGMFWNTLRGLKIRGGSSGAYNLIVAENSTGSANDHTVKLYASNVLRLQTTTTGVSVTGDIKIDSALLSHQENINVDTGTETVATVAHATYTAAFFDYVIKNGTNVRAGTVYSCHDGTNVEFTETSTVDLGDTSDVTLAVDISGTDMRLRATTTSNDWSVKSLVRAI